MLSKGGLHPVKRVNFNMDAECHALLKGVCALKGVTISEYVQDIINEDFLRKVREDKQIQTMFLAGDYKEGTPASIFKQALLEELNQPNDSST